VAVAVPVGVAVGVTAPSSRKTISGLAHQLILCKARVEGVGVAGALPPPRPEHALSRILARIRLAVR
jgi:hypothetical protein